MTPVVRLLITFNVAAFLVEAWLSPEATAWLALWPLGRFHVPELDGPVGFAPWQLVTHGFLHANLAHLGLNMLGLYMFGRDVESVLGGARFALLYSASLLTGGLTQLAVVSFLQVAEPYPTVGASGAVFGVLLAFAMLYPRRTVVLLFPPIPMQAQTFVALYAAIELYLGVTGTAAGIAHFAHLGGMAGAWLELRRWRR